MAAVRLAGTNNKSLRKKTLNSTAELLGLENYPNYIISIASDRLNKLARRLVERRMELGTK